MAFISVPNVCQFNLRASVNGVPIENVFHLKKGDETAWSLPDIIGAAEEMGSAWQAEMLPVLAGGYQARTVYARDLTTEAGLVYEASFAADAFGTASGETMPGSVAVCITHRTGLAGRSYRGRTYISGMSELSVNGNNIVTGFAATLITNFIAFKDLVVDAGYVWGIVSRYHNLAPRAVGIFTRITASTLRDTRVDTQRRRLS